MFKNGGNSMAQRNWDKVAKKEFESLDKVAQEQWTDLRKIVQKR
jgi:hypothetical protein